MRASAVDALLVVVITTGIPRSSRPRAASIAVLARHIRIVAAARAFLIDALGYRARIRRVLHFAGVIRILNHMAQYTNTRLDASFAALSDATRRGVLEQLVLAEASITDLATKFDFTLTGMKKHVSVLEQAGLVTTEKTGRVRTCKLGPRRLEEEVAWMERLRELWTARFDELDKVVDRLKRKEKVDARNKRK
jgi:DNA-binding transcriptional ArsR family regulator